MGGAFFYWENVKNADVYAIMAFGLLFLYS